MTFIQILENDESRKLVEAIEDTLASLRRAPTDRRLNEILRSLIDELRSATGFTYTIEA